MTDVKIPLETIEQCDDGQSAVFNEAQINRTFNQPKLPRRKIKHEAIFIFFFAVFVIIGTTFVTLKFYSVLFGKSTLKLNFEIKGDAYEYNISHADAESEMQQLSSLLDNNSIQYFGLNKTIKFVNYLEVSNSLSYLLPEVRVIHDFHGNFTSIINDKKEFCYFMPIQRTILTPPASLADLKIKLISHYYATELEKSMRDTVLVKPFGNNLAAYVKIIPETCDDYGTYKIMGKM